MTRRQSATVCCQYDAVFIDVVHILEQFGYFGGGDVIFVSVLKNIAGHDRAHWTLYHMSKAKVG